ncbi:MAG: dephospho-CoA kinase [Planctomycetota bacterium]
MSAGGQRRPPAPDGERVLFDARPSIAWIFVRAIPEAIPAAVLGMAVWLLRGLLVASAGTIDRGLAGSMRAWLGYLLVAAGAYALARFGWAALDRLGRRYVLTDVRIIAQRGVVRTLRVDLPLRRVQHLAVSRSLLERVFGVGTVSAAAAGTDAHEVVWRAVASPEAQLSMVRARVDDIARRGDEPDPIPVIGLVGGIGSGKSVAAHAFEKLGCIVSDSDAAVREVLARVEVVEELVSWWGEGILDPERRIDRRKVADLVFGDDFQRRRLEALIHPLVRETREALIARAREHGARGVIVDAPLLFEAGVDAECDAVVFVEAPRSVRIERVEARGWDEKELDRRENAQMSLEEKRRRSDHVLVNHGALDELESRAANLLAAIRKHSRSMSRDGEASP